MTEKEFRKIEASWIEAENDPSDFVDNIADYVGDLLKEVAAKNGWEPKDWY